MICVIKYKLNPCWQVFWSYVNAIKWHLIFVFFFQVLHFGSMIHFEVISVYNARYDQLLLLLFLFSSCIERFKLSSAICYSEPSSMQDLSSPMSIKPAPTGRQSLNHWTTRKSLKWHLKMAFLFLTIFFYNTWFY